MKTLYPFQEENVSQGSRRHVLIADDCGLGKTVSAIETGKATRQRGASKFGVPWRALVICPKGVRWQWLSEIDSQDPEQSIHVVTNAGEIGKDARGWYIMHYEAVMRYPPTHLLWDLIVLDEAHRIRNRNAQRTKAIKKLSSLRRVALSGTPMDKDPSEMWSIWNWLYPQEFTSYWRFRNAFCEMSVNDYGFSKVAGPKNVDLLAKQLKGRFLRHTKEMVAPQMPPKVFVDVPLRMEDEQLDLYEAIRNSKDIEVITEHGSLRIANALALIVRLQQAASCPQSLGPEFDLPSVKVDWTLEFIEDHSELSIVVFTRFVATAQKLLTTLNEGGVLAEGFFGAHAQFPTAFLDGTAKVLVVTIAKAGEGLDLKHANAAIFIDQEWSTIKMQQAYDRIHRLGVNDVKMLYRLTCSPVDELIQEAIEKKWNDAQLIYQAIERQVLHEG
jgi:SNF2 family DNA or RNA helicase